MAEKIESDKMFELLFEYATKTIADLKAREWQATVLAIAGIAWVYGQSDYASAAPHARLIWTMAFVVSAHASVMLRCMTNIKKARCALKKKIFTKGFPDKALDLFNEIIPDEGMIAIISFALVWIAAGLATWDMWPK